MSKMWSKENFVISDIEISEEEYNEWMQESPIGIGIIITDINYEPDILFTQSKDRYTDIIEILSTLDNNLYQSLVHRNIIIEEISRFELMEI